MSTRLSGLVLRSQSDERLAELAAAGQEPAFAVLVQRYQQDLTAHAKRIVGESRADDAVQDGFSRTWQSLQHGSELQNVRAWLYRVVGNAALDLVRERARSGGELSDQLPGGLDPAAEVAAGIETRAMLEQLAGLPQQQRDALLLTAVEGRSGEEAAAMLGVSGGALSQLVFRARTAMRATMTAITPYPVLTWATTTSDVAVGGAALAGGFGVKALAALALGGATVGGATVAVKQEEKKNADRSTIERTTTAAAPAPPTLGGGGRVGTTTTAGATEKNEDRESNGSERERGGGRSGDDSPEDGGSGAEPDRSGRAREPDDASRSGSDDAGGGGSGRDDDSGSSGSTTREPSSDSGRSGPEVESGSGGPDPDSSGSGSGSPDDSSSSGSSGSGRGSRPDDDPLDP